MMRAVAILLAMAVPAGAECFGADRMPRKVTFDSGEVVRILSRRGEVLRYAQDLGSVGRAEHTTHAALIPLETRVQGKTFTYVWDQALPHAADLRPGQRIVLKGRVSGGISGRMELSLHVLAAETLRLGGCAHDTLVIDTVTKVDGRQVARVRRHFDPDTLLVLASIADNPDAADPSRLQMARVAVRID